MFFVKKFGEEVERNGIYINSLWDLFWRPDFNFIDILQ